MHNQTLDWIALRAITEIRNGESFPEDVAYDLGGMPFIDVLREKIMPEDKKHILRLIKDGHWWHRYLGINLSRPILDQEIAEIVRGAWKQEEHFHTKLAMIYLLLHYGQPELQKEEMIAQLEEKREDFIACIENFYGGHPTGTWGALCLRLEDPKYEGARPIYLLSLLILAGASEHKTKALPDIVHELTESNDQLIRNLAIRLENAVS